MSSGARPNDRRPADRTATSVSRDIWWLSEPTPLPSRAEALEALRRLVETELLIREADPAPGADVIDIAGRGA